MAELLGGALPAKATDDAPHIAIAATHSNPVSSDMELPPSGQCVHEAGYRAGLQDQGGRFLAPPSAAKTSG